MVTDFPKTMKVLSEGYHGTWDPFVSLTSPATGVPPDPNMEKLDPALNEEQIASASAVIVEPVMTDWSQQRIDWLQRLRDICTKYDTILIFDEVITNCRYKKHSVAAATGIYPDLMVIGKAVANGFPLAAVGGKKELMDGNYFVSSTYAGEVLSLVSCMWTVDMLLNNGAYKIDRLWEQGLKFIEHFNAVAPPGLKLEGYPTRGSFTGDPLTKALFFQEAVKAGFLFGPSWFSSFANCEHDYKFFTFFKDFTDRLRLGSVQLQGRMPKSPFAERVRSGNA